MGNDALSRRTPAFSPLPPGSARSARPSRRAALAALLASALATGCSSAAGAGPSGGRVTLRYFFWGDKTRAELLGKCIALFQREHKNIEVNPVFVAFDSYWQKLTTAAAGGSPPDVMHVDFAFLRTLADHGVLADLSDHTGPGKEIEADTIIPTLRTTGIVEDRRFALPLSQNCLSIMYDAEVYEQAGARPPDATMSWDTYIEQTVKIREFTKGRSAGIDDPGQNYMGLHIWLHQRGRQMWSPEGQLTVTPDEFHDFLAFYQRWRRTGGTTTPAEILEAEPSKTIGVGSAAAMLEWDNQVGSRSSLRGKPLKLAAVPTDSDTTGVYPKSGILVGAAARSPYPSEAARFMNFLINDPRVARILGSNIGMRSVHFEWLLDVRHGADYFRRWHREKRHSGGLLVHKSGHHFDLVNWWLGAAPSRVYAEGGLVFYGRDNGERTGLRRDYDRAHGSPAAADDPFALHLADNPALTALYLDAEAEPGTPYLRDRNVFGDGIDIEDDLSVLVRYDSGATMTYHLTAYSPWEGYRVMFNGTGGRLELEVEENTWQPPRAASASGSAHGGVAMAHPGRTRILLRPLWREPEEVPFETAAGAHGGGDLRMLKELFGPLGDGTDDGATPAAGKGATARDGALALAVGIAGNESLVTGVPVAADGLY